jgi:nitroimidazol reductase NimA-like FMN-containing flavoprotein (pyridoxamine 5'-phosphate oxidase superfamily)
MPPLTDNELDSFLMQAPIARLCTHNSNGSIHAAPIWFKYDNGEILFGTQDDSRRITNIKKNSDVTVVVDTEATPYKGVVIYGKARLDYDDVIPKRVAIFEKYMPKANAEKLANGLAELRKPVVIHVKPTKMTSYDYGKDQSGLFK